ncbi:hydrolase 1, exosortase A system-associated [Oxalobacteraceae bacterium A2-2]
MTQQSEAAALTFWCQDSLLTGILHLPATSGPRGVLVVTGGPQYRVGSHRQFVLLARRLAQAGIPVLRFDYRGMGDSGGAMQGYQHIGPDLDAALDAFFARVPALREVVLWGLCDGATAAALYAAGDHRVAGLVLLNPWVHTGSGLARATLRHYYWQRLLDPGFWRKLAGGRLRPGTSLRSLGELAAGACAPARPDSLPHRLRQALGRFSGQVLILLSGADLGAREFMALADTDPDWRHLLARPQMRQHLIPRANHTCSSRTWRGQVERLCVDWMASW